MWCIAPEQDAAFVAQMEQVLEVYKRPYDDRHPVVCMDEQPKQLIGESRGAVPAAPGRPARVDYEYIREGLCEIWMFVEPLGGWRDVRVSARKAALDWAGQIKALVDDPRYEKAERITLVCDNLNTHCLSSLYAAFEPGEALRIARKLEIVHTPKHGSWLNIAECELSVLTRQCLSERIATQDIVASNAMNWKRERNEKQTGVKWHFATEDARVKLLWLYPKIIA
jgi:DDE superfamily endonuclease